MIAKPFNEGHRLNALQSYCHEKGIRNESLDRLTRLACALFRVPTCLVSLVTENQQVFRSQQGLDAASTPREHAFCSHTILGRKPMVIANATRDPRFADNPLVTGSPGIRFYAGAPIVTPIGFRLGTFCVIDTVPRADFDASKRDLLTDLAALAMSILDTERRQAGQSASDAETIATEDASFDALSTVAHDIREPLATIVSLSGVIETQAFGPLGEPRYREYAADITRTGSFLLELSRKILDVARLRSGDLDVEPQPLAIRALLDESARLVVGQAERQSVDIRVQAEIGDVRLNADPVMLKQMLVNLLSNAIRFSRPKSEVLLEAVMQMDGTLFLCVVDQGVGMTASEVTIAQKPFGRIRADGAYDGGGVGLGLHLVQRSIHAHGGELLIESHPGKGTAATLKFPAYRLEQSDGTALA